MNGAFAWRRVAGWSLAVTAGTALALLWLRWGETIFARQLGALLC